MLLDNMNSTYCNCLHPQDIYYIENVVSTDLEKEAIKFIEENELKWNVISGKIYTGVKKQRCGFGKSNQEKIPDILLEIGQSALLYAKENCKNPELLEKLQNFTLDNLIINRYFPGDKCGAHFDPPRKDPFVFGLTLGSLPETKRTMRWRYLKQKYDIITNPRSLYIFYGDAFNNWKHESVASKKQIGTIYSLTFRKHRNETISLNDWLGPEEI